MEFDVSCEWLKFRRKQTIKEWKIKTVQCTYELFDGRISAHQLELKFMICLHCWITRHLYSVAVIFGMFASRIEAKFGEGFSANETKSKLPNLTKHTGKSTQLINLVDLSFGWVQKDWGSTSGKQRSCCCISFVHLRKQWKSWMEWDVKCFGLCFGWKLFVWKKSEKHLLYELKPPTRHPLLRVLSTTLIAFLLTSQRNHVELFFGIWDAHWDVVPESVAHVIVCVFLLAAKEKWKVWKKIQLQEDSSHNKKLLFVSF